MQFTVRLNNYGLKHTKNTDSASCRSFLYDKIKHDPKDFEQNRQLCWDVNF